MQMPTWKSAFFGHAAFSVVFVRIIWFFGTTYRRITYEPNGVIIVFADALYCIFVFFTLAALLASKAVLAQRYVHPDTEARLESAKNTLYGWGWQRRAVRVASLFWFVAAVSNAAAFADMRLHYTLENVSLYKLWPPLIFITTPLILSFMLTHPFIAIYILFIWPKTATSVTPNGQVSVLVPLSSVRVQAAGPMPARESAGPPPAYEPLPVGPSAEEGLGTVPATAAANDNEVPK